MIRFKWSVAPASASPVQKRNFRNVQIDAIGVGLASAAAPFLPVFLVRLGATNFQVGLLTSMPAVTGLFLALVVGRFLQTRRQIVPWFGFSRMLSISAYALTGLAAFIVPRQYLVEAILIIWAMATLPQTMISVSFNVVMGAVAGPEHRYELMSRRWSVLGLTTAICVVVVGQVLDHIGFPINYQLVFLVLSLGGLISYFASTHIDLPDTPRVPRSAGVSLRENARNYARIVLGQREFMRFSIQRFVFVSGTMLSVPLFPLYFVRVVHASDAWIGTINTTQTAVLLIGYFIWTRGSRLRGSRFVLLWTTLGLTFYPALVAMTQRVEMIVLLAGLAGIFQAGLDLVFFDELMSKVPPEQSTTFVSIAQTLQYIPTIFAPMIGTLLSDLIGIGGALLVSAALRLAGFGLFALWKDRKEVEVVPVLKTKSEMVHVRK